MLTFLSAALILHFGYALSYILYFVRGTSVPPCTVGLPSIVFMNNMSSHIYRDMRFGFYRDDTTGSSVINRELEGSEEDSQNQGDHSNSETHEGTRGSGDAADIETARRERSQSTTP